MPRTLLFKRTFPFALLGLALAMPAGAANWWLPSNHAEHGKDADNLFVFVFWLTSIVTVGVFAFMAYFLIKYRANPERKKAHYSHGNTRLEIAWTIIPAFFLAAIVIWTKGSWEKFRMGDPGDTRKPANILVIAQQYAWNVIYAGPDGKLGKYLVFPKPSDKTWPPKRDKDGKLVYETFDYNGTDTNGPADLPFNDAVSAINSYIETNPLGKVYSDQDGLDDVVRPVGESEIQLPAGRPVVIELSSKDVLHSFFLPNFRVKLDAVPGLRGVIRFVPMGPTSDEREADPANRFSVSPDELLDLLHRFENKALQIVVDEKSPGATQDQATKAWGYNDKQGKPLISHGKIISMSDAARLREAGIKQITYRRAGYFDLVCEELCGVGHGDMRGRVLVITPKEYSDRFETARKVEE